MCPSQESDSEGNGPPDGDASAMIDSMSFAMMAADQLDLGYERRHVDIKEKASRTSLADQKNFQYQQMLQRTKSTENTTSSINENLYSSIKQKQRRRLIQVQEAAILNNNIKPTSGGQLIYENFMRQSNLDDQN